MSLAEEILYGSPDGVRYMLEQGADPNELDAYGLRPLIEAILMGNLAIVKLLLEHGAIIEQKDITGQSPLQWAINRNQLAIASYLLQQGANPNHTALDGQPILTYPLLRKNQDLIKLLLDYGAEQWLAEDYIHAKLLGHRFELTGKIDILNASWQLIELDFEGFYLEFTMEILAARWAQFIATNTHTNISHVVNKAWQTLNSCATLIKYKYQQDLQADLEPLRTILNTDLVVLPIAYEGHAITLVKYGKLLAKCDRGVSNFADTVIIYQAPASYLLNSNFFEELLLQNKDSAFINQEIKKILQLEAMVTLPTPMQIAGNCSWANVEAAIPTMLFMLLFKGDFSANLEVAQLKNTVMAYYYSFVEWDKDQAINECIAQFNAVGEKRKLVKVLLLQAILQQRLKANNPADIKRAQQILKILSLPPYKKLLKTLLKVYLNKMSGKAGANLYLLLQQAGLNLQTLTLR